MGAPGTPALTGLRSGTQTCAFRGLRALAAGLDRAPIPLQLRPAGLPSDQRSDWQSLLSLEAFQEMKALCSEREAERCMSQPFSQQLSPKANPQAAWKWGICMIGLFRGVPGVRFVGVYVSPLEEFARRSVGSWKLVLALGRRALYCFWEGSVGIEVVFVLRPTTELAICPADSM